MGSAEDRQVEKMTAAQRIQQHQAERELERGGHLGEIRRKREDQVLAISRARGARKGVRAAVGLAILSPDPVADFEIAEAAGWTVGAVAALRRQLRG